MNNTILPPTLYNISQPFFNSFFAIIFIFVKIAPIIRFKKEIMGSSIRCRTPPRVSLYIKKPISAPSIT